MGATPKIVALLGVSGSGKTIVAARLLAATFRRIRFADAARDMLTVGFGCSPDEIDGVNRGIGQRRFGGHTVQSLMRSLSHDWGRGTIHSDIWVNEWRRRVDLLEAAHPDEQLFVLADDVQRPNEAAAVRDAGGIIVRVTRLDYVPRSGASFHRQAEIAADVELINERPDKLALLTDRFIAGLKEQLATAAA